MNTELLAGMALVLAVLAVMTILVFVSRARVERTHREQDTPPHAGADGEPRDG